MNHIPIRVSTLRGDQEIAFDAYVKINDKFILYVRHGDSFEGPRLQRLRDKKLKKMYIRPEGEKSYRDYLARNIELAYNSNSGKSLEARAEIIQGDQQTFAEEIMERPADMATYLEAKAGAARFVQLLLNEEAAFAKILNIENLDKNIAHHGVTVATLAVHIGKRLGVDSKLLQLLSLGCLLHDFEHFHSALDVGRPISHMTPVELKVYQDHPMNAGRKVQTLKHFDQTVVNIITQHEEYIDGKGWPQGLKESQSDPMSVVASSANAMDRILTFEGVPRKEAVKLLMMNGVGKHPLQHLQLLGDLINQLI